MKRACVLIVLGAVLWVAACGSTQSNPDGGAGGAMGVGGRGGSGGTGGGGAGGSSTGDAAADGPDGMACALDGGQCPAGYRCACGGPGPIGMCTCHKECTSASECVAPGETCGCTPSDPAPRICVNACFCTCD